MRQGKAAELANRQRVGSSKDNGGALQAFKAEAQGGFGLELVG